MASRLFETALAATSEEAVDFITNILAAWAAPSCVGKKGARRLYGREPHEGRHQGRLIDPPQRGGRGGGAPSRVAGRGPALDQVGRGFRTYAETMTARPGNGDRPRR